MGETGRTRSTSLNDTVSRPRPALTDLVSPALVVAVCIWAVLSHHSCRLKRPAEREPCGSDNSADEDRLEYPAAKPLIVH